MPAIRPYALTAAIAALLLVAITPAKANFRYYPGFLDPYGTIEMVHDKGLMLEIHVRCSRTRSGAIRAGIMSYSKVERLFCTPGGARCTRDAVRAARNTCGG